MYPSTVAVGRNLRRFISKNKVYTSYAAVRRDINEWGPKPLSEKLDSWPGFVSTKRSGATQRFSADYFPNSPSQSRGLRKSLYNRSSGVPGSGL